MGIFNVHTHSVQDYPHIINIRDVKSWSVPHSANQYQSVGIHPWDANNCDINLLKTILQSSKSSVVSIGECGIDRIKGPSMDIQHKCFEKQLYLAAEHQLPMTIHSVRAISDVLSYMKKFPNLFYVFHGYSGNTTQTNQLLKYNTWFSFGEQMLRKNSKITEVLQIIPVNRIFFETDDSDLDIREIYRAYCHFCNINITELTNAVHQNVNSVFKITVENNHTE